MGAKYSLGMMYFTGTGVEKDMKRAFEYFAKAADKGHAKAQYNLGFYMTEVKELCKIMSRLLNGIVVLQSKAIRPQNII